MTASAASLLLVFDLKKPRFEVGHNALNVLLFLLQSLWWTLGEGMFYMKTHKAKVSVEESSVARKRA